MTRWEQFVAETLREEDADAAWIDDLAAHGCESGMVGSLVYYTDTAAVYDRHEDEILDVLESSGYEDPEPWQLVPFARLACARVWAAFELTAPGVFPAP
jgi:hypothetical protein